MTIVDSEFGIDRPDVPTHRLSADEERCRNFHVLAALSEERQYLFFPLRKFAGIMRGKIVAADLREKQPGRPEFTGSNRVNRSPELPGGRVRP